MTLRALDVFVDAGPAIGYGHLRRCLSVAAQLRDEHAVACRFLMPRNSDGTQVRGAGFPLQQVDDLADFTAASEAPAALLIDTPNMPQDTLDMLAAAGVALALFDDGRRLDYYAADIVIDSSPVAPYLGYTGRDDTVFCLGLDYFPLRPEFTQVRRRAEISRDVRNLVVTFGGSDPDDATLLIAQALAPAATVAATTFVLGPGYRGGLTAPPWPTASLQRNASNMACVLASADLAISGAGGTALELAYLGVPAILIALSRDQTGIAQALDHAGAAQSLGTLGQFTSGRFETVLFGLFDDASRRARMARNGQAMVDGKGIGRICAMLAEHLLADLAA